MPSLGPEAAGVWLSVSVPATLGRLLWGRAHSDSGEETGLRLQDRDGDPLTRGE